MRFQKFLCRELISANIAFKKKICKTKSRLIANCLSEWMMTSDVFLQNLPHLFYYLAALFTITCHQIQREHQNSLDDLIHMIWSNVSVQSFSNSEFIGESITIIRPVRFWLSGSYESYLYVIPERFCFEI